MKSNGLGKMIIDINPRGFFVAIGFIAQIHSREMGADTQMETYNISPPLLEELYENAPKSKFFLLQPVYFILYLTLCTLSKLVAGQFILSFLDYFIVKLQQTIEYGMPPDMPGDVKVARVEKPMNWLFLIPALFNLLLIRSWLSVFSIVFGSSEVTQKHMLVYVVEFRRYYRSVRHFSICGYSKTNALKKESRCSKSGLWSFAYGMYENIIMTKPPHDDAD